MILPEEELARIEKILQRSNDKVEGKLDMSNIELTEDNPDGLDISLYKGEDQLDEIEKRKSEKEKAPKKGGAKKKNEKKEDEKVEPEEKLPEQNSEVKKGRGRPKKESTSEKDEQKSEPAAKSGGKRERRKASKNMSYEQYDFLEEEDDEVMPAPKKRKSQDSINDEKPAEIGWNLFIS